MNTTNSTRTVYRILVLWVTLLVGAVAQGQDFTEGKDYVTLTGEATILPDGRIEVIEFFWFGCPSCFRFESTLVAWQKPETVNFINVPTVWNRSTEFHAHVYYSMELLGLNDELMQPFYDELHVKRNKINNLEDFEQWASAQPGIDAGKLTSTVLSFGTRTKVAQADLLANQYGVTGVPTLVVAGKYRTSPSMVGSAVRALDVVEYLVNRVLSEQ